MSTSRGITGWLALPAWIALSLTAGAAGALASVNAADFYTTIRQPAWAPPSWVFGPVWTTLYVLMGTGAWLVWREKPAPGTAQATLRARGLVLFVVQLVLNGLWTWLFFAWRLGAWALAEIIVLWVAIAVTIGLFAKVRRAAAWCLVPYLAWVTFAAALTWALWRGNPGQL